MCHKHGTEVQETDAESFVQAAVVRQQTKSIFEQNVRNYSRKHQGEVQGCLVVE